MNTPALTTEAADQIVEIARWRGSILDIAAKAYRAMIEGTGVVCANGATLWEACSYIMSESARAVAIERAGYAPAAHPERLAELLTEGR